MQNISAVGIQAQTCLFGQVNVFTPTGLGAVNGTITPLFSTPIPITQVVGPAGGAISLNQVNGQFAFVCGRFQVSGGQVFLNVNTVIPISLGTLLGGLGGLGATRGTTTGI